MTRHDILQTTREHWSAQTRERQDAWDGLGPAERLAAAFEAGAATERAAREQAQRDAEDARTERNRARQDLLRELRDNGWRQCAIGQSVTQFCQAGEQAAEQARLAEREACAQECDAVYRRIIGWGAQACAAQIRARARSDAA